MRPKTSRMRLIAAAAMMAWLAAPLPLAAVGGLAEEQALLGSPVIDLVPMPEDIAKGRVTPADLKRHLRDLFANAETVRGTGAYINRRRYFDRGTLLNPWSLYQPDGSNPVIPPAGQLVGQKLAPEGLSGQARQDYLESYGIEELSQGYRKNGVTFRFMDIKFTYALQKVPNCKNLPDERPHRAEFDLGDEDFQEKYYVLTEGTDHSGREFRFGDRISANPQRKAFHPAEVSFDPGVADGAEPPVQAGEGDAGQPNSDVLMEVFVKLDGRVDSFDGSDWTTAMDFTDMNLVAKRSFYMEDVVPPLPSTVDINESPVEIELPEYASANKVPPQHDFVIPARLGEEATDASAQSAFWPNSVLDEDLDGDGQNDHKFQPVHVLDRNSNTDASDIVVSFNYETGVSLQNRVKVTEDDGSVRYMYLILPEQTESGLVGPYGGRVGQAPAPNEIAEYDYYEPTGELVQIAGLDQPVTLQELLDPFYKPLNVASDAELKSAVDFLGTHNPVEVQRGTRPGEDGTAEYANATYKRLAGMSINEERETVQGISCEVFDNNSSCDGHMACTVDFKFRVSPGSLIPPMGFASFESGRYRASLDAETSNREGPASLSGGPLNPLDAADSYYQINAGDGCGNTTIFKAGTYAVRDGLKPNLKVILEEMYTRPGRDERLVDVVSVPNDIGGAGDPIGEYDLSRPHSRLSPLSELAADARLYGNHRNNVERWDYESPLGSPSNPSDARGASFLAVRGGPDAETIQEDSRFLITVVAEDNVAPKLDRSSATARFLYPVSHFSARIWRTDGPSSDTLEKVFIDVPEAQRDDPAQFTQAPYATFEHVFRSAGEYLMEVTAVDRSDNRRVMRFRIPVGDVAMRFRQVEDESERGEGD